MEKEFIRVRSTKDIVITLTLIVAGCILVALPTSTPVNICGFFMIFAGIILLLILKTGYKEVGSGAKYCKIERYFSQDMHADIKEMLEAGSDKLDLSKEDKGNAVRLDIYHSKSAGKAYLQLFEYIPYKYEPCSEVYEYELAKASKLIGK